MTVQGLLNKEYFLSLIQQQGCNTIIPLKQQPLSKNLKPFKSYVYLPSSNHLEYYYDNSNEGDATSNQNSSKV
jgi:hypothetical protein